MSPFRVALSALLPRFPSSGTPQLATTNVRYQVLMCVYLFEVFTCFFLPCMYHRRKTGCNRGIGTSPSNPHFGQDHPMDKSVASRMQCLEELRRIIFVSVMPSITRPAGAQCSIAPELLGRLVDCSGQFRDTSHVTTATYRGSDEELGRMISDMRGPIDQTPYFLMSCPFLSQDITPHAS